MLIRRVVALLAVLGLSVGAAEKVVKIDDLVAQLRKEIAANPGAPEPNVKLAEILLAQERFDEGDEAIKAALKVNPQASDLHRAQGDLLFREGHVFEADAEYKAAFRLDKQNARALYGVARTFRVSGLRAKSASLMRVARALAPEDEEIARAIDTLDSSSPAALARWEKALNDPATKDDSDRKIYLEARIGEAKALNGSHAFELASPYQPYQLRYRQLVNGKRATGIGLTISVNGVKSELRVDTGAGGVTVSSRFAEKAGIKRIARSRMSGAGNQGDVETWIGYAESMQIGDLEFKNILVDVKEKGSVDDSGGLLGTDIFKRFLVKVDFFHGQIDLDPLPGPAWDGYTPVDRYEGPELKGFTQFLQVHHYILLPTMVSEKEKSDQTNCLFLVDTGAGLNNISTNLASSVTKVRNNDYLTVKGVSGKVKMLYEADRVVLQFANYRQTNLDLTAFDLSHLSRSGGLEVSGILGLPVLALFQSFTIDYRDGRIGFDFKR